MPVGRVGVVSVTRTGGNGNAWLGLDSEVDEVFTQHSQRKDGEATRRQPASEVTSGLDFPSYWGYKTEAF